MSQKSAMTSVLDGLKESIAARKEQIKTAELSTTQGTAESAAPGVTADDPEVAACKPAGNGMPADPGKNLITELGVEVTEKVPGQPDPSEEKDETKETSPESKLANLHTLQARVSSVVKVAADQVTAYLEQKKAEGTPAPGSDDPQSVPPIPSGGGKDLTLGGGAKMDTSASAPQIPGTDGVTQTDVPSGKASTDLPQGPQEQKVGAAELDLDALANKIAMASHHYGIGQAMGYQAASLFNRDPKDGIDKTASASVSNEMVRKIAAAGANEALALGVQNGIFTEKQATELQKLAGIAPHPVDVAIAKYQAKVAGLMKSASLSPEKAVEFISKVAMHDEAGAAAMAGGDPAATGSVQPEMQDVVAQIAQAVESGQMTEEQALQVLQELGIPVDQILAQQGGGAGAPMTGADPMAAAGGAPPPAGLPAGAGGPPPVDPAAAMGGAPAPGGVPPMSDPAAAAEVAGAMGAGGPPAGGPAGGPPADPAAAMGGDPAAAMGGGAPAPGAGGPPPGAGAPPEGKPEGGKSEGGDKKEEGGDKKSDDKKDEGKKDDGGDKKSDDKKDDKKPEGESKSAAQSINKVADAGIDPTMTSAGGGAAAPMDPAAGGGDPAAAMGDPGAGGAGGQDPQALLQQIVQDLQAAVSAGMMSEEDAQKVLADLSGGGAPADPSAGAAAPPAPGGDPGANAAPGGQAMPPPAAPVA